MKSPTYNTMQVCKKAQCPFDTSRQRHREPRYPAVRARRRDGRQQGADSGQRWGFFLHTTDGGPTAGCVAIDDATLVEIMRWLRPGALIAITQ